MSKHSLTSDREKIPGYDSLEELALDLVWCWTHCADSIWKQLDLDLWERTNNPWVVLQTVSKERLEQLLADPAFRKSVDELVKDRRFQTTSTGWFQDKHPGSPLNSVAYFSMEYLLSEALPIYSGGLGNVAGDQLKAANDLGIPVTAIGLLYQQGYFRQVIDKEGAQQAYYPYNSPGQLPITPLRKANGEWVRFEIALPGWSVWVRAWQAKVGRVRLYLLDSNDAVNYPPHRGITSELYGGDSEMRLKQELILGIGGWRLLDALGIHPDVCHLNEGHAAFAVLERAKCYMKKTGESFETALAATRAGNLFTTHTAVPAGFDRFSPDLIEHYLGTYAEKQLGIPLEQFLALGRNNPNDSSEPFNMAYLAIRGCGAVNGVSQLHGKVSRAIFQHLFPRWPQEEVPVSSVTNGVHMPTWDSILADKMWSDHCGANRWRGKTQEELEKDMLAVPDTEIWNMRKDSRKHMIEYGRERVSRMWQARGMSEEDAEAAKHIFDPNVLTLGFARRFATYKRPNMLLHDQNRLKRILTHAERPVQLVLAGKAHPADKPGQALIQEWIRFIHQSDIRSHVIFLSDYDMMMTQVLVGGVDVWINTPRRPWEACGTSGMKVLVNGGLNLSELDGWWAEAYTPEVGWALGDGQEHGADPAWDAYEANTLYDILENQVIPEFYTRNQEGIPTAWVKKIRLSMARLTPRFSAGRAVREYTEKYYIPAATNFKARTGGKAAEIINWKHALNMKWNSLRFGEVAIKTVGKQHQFEVHLDLDGLDPKAVKVELFALGTDGAPPIIEEMKLVRGNLYQGTVSAERPASHYTPRAIPQFPGVAVPLESREILWQR